MNRRFLLFICFYSSSSLGSTQMLRHVECAVYILNNDRACLFLSLHAVLTCVACDLSFCRNSRWTWHSYTPGSLQWKAIAVVQLDEWTGNAASIDQWAPRSRLRRVPLCSPSLHGFLVRRAACQNTNAHTQAPGIIQTVSQNTPLLNYMLRLLL